MAVEGPHGTQMVRLAAARKPGGPLGWNGLAEAA